jgi:hypothetical protein
MHQLKEKNSLIYVDSGDMLFPGSTIPDSLKKSLTFAAENLAMALDKLGLRYFVPGDQDFAAGLEFLNKISKKVKFTFLISNLSEPHLIKHQEWSKIEKGPHRIYLLGIVNPSTIPAPHNRNFLAPKASLKRILPKLVADGYKKDDPFHRLIVISHSGMTTDKSYALAFPEIDWIIGAHTQSFTRYPVDQGKTQIVQVLSRNHYMGEVRISLQHDKKSDKFHQHEVSENLDKKLVPNPYVDFIQKHKDQLAKLQEEEQNLLADNADSETQFLRTSASCMECHSHQGDHWQKTPHAIAYVTLLNANEAKNTQCIKCHSVGLNNPKGFYRASDMVKFYEDDVPKEKLKAHQDNYWKEVKKAFGGIESVRALKPKQIVEHTKKWLALDEKMKVSHNFSNVQCLNCHDKHQEHPFNLNQAKVSPEKKYQMIKSKCIQCHDADQSPEWYRKDEKSLPTILDEAILKSHIAAMGCPKKPKEED